MWCNLIQLFIRRKKKEIIEKKKRSIKQKMKKLNLEMRKDIDDCEITRHRIQN
jgi:hypothetical protein